MARTARNDVLDKFRFRLAWDDMDRAGFHDVQMPKRTTNKIQYREGTSPDIYSISAGLSTMEDITLSRGLAITQADFAEMVAWADLVHDGADSTAAFSFETNFILSNDNTQNSEDYRKEVTITIK